MAITKPSEEHFLSDYEKLRLEKIKRNEDRMKELGLFRSKDILAASAKKRTATKSKKTKLVSPELPQRRSSRQRKTVVDYIQEQVIPMYENDEEKAKEDDSYSDDESDSNSGEEEDEYDISEDDNNEDDVDDEMEEERPKKRSRPSKPVKVSSSSVRTSSEPKNKKAAIDTSFDCINPKGGLTLEYAKTGRSSCRKCRNKIEKGAPRVGMEAWIVGRNCVTWQCPSCLLQNMCCAYERSGKGTCKASRVPFEKGQLKIGIRCHTATSYYRVDAIVGVLVNVVSLMRTEVGQEDFKLTIDGIDGHEKLSDEDEKKLESIIETVFQTQIPRQGIAVPEETKSSTTEAAESPVKQEPDTKPKKRNRNSSSRDQPKLGVKTGAKGKVEWKFGGRSCYGLLIPRMENLTHCYARTHKGNVKTLAKGKDYWSMLE